MTLTKLLVARVKGSNLIQSFYVTINLLDTLGDGMGRWKETESNYNSVELFKTVVVWQCQSSILMSNNCLVESKNPVVNLCIKLINSSYSLSYKWVKSWKAAERPVTMPTNRQTCSMLTTASQLGSNLRLSRFQVTTLRWILIEAVLRKAFPTFRRSVQGFEHETPL